MNAVGTKNREDLVFKIAAILLLEKGEISFEDIRAIPFIENQAKVSEVVNYLLREFNAETVQRSVGKKPYLKWERVIRLRS